MDDIMFSYDHATGKLHIDNSNHPGVTTANCIQVLTNHALLIPNPRFPGQYLATGETDGKYPILTVCFLRTKAGLKVITAFPPDYPDKKYLAEEYYRLKKEGIGGLCRPVQPT